MPSRQKTLMFLSGFFASIGSFSVICVALGTQNWVSSVIAYKDANSNGIISITYGLFEGVSEKEKLDGPGLGAEAKHFRVLEELTGTGSPEAVNILIILLLILCLVCSAMSSGITCYNSVSNPYQDCLGPIGLYAWNAINGIFTFLAMILFVVNTEANKQPSKLANDKLIEIQFLDAQNSYGYSFWLLLLIIFLNAATIAIMYFYQYARHRIMMEQQRPMESAPEDVILF
ncbi:clarin-3 [Microcaecilia unicolor]|uniref:Clarin-3 n=1 Tax=Microcaecilia unicolor TaxID=1415580 RepID=A0A6P7XZ70_9AMPH|nr:clarin-3 [Microcaecilia unicolor]